jgi:uncharacterized protein YbjT (DUF2867 family)
MSGKKAIVLGASGQVGHLLIEQLLKDEYFELIRILTRRPFDIKNPKIEEKIIDFENESEFKNALGKADIIFSCIGTTMRKVKGNKELYRKIDFDIPVNSAKWGYENGLNQFALVSAVGADPGSGNFYLRLKGEVEKSISVIPFESIHLMRPSFLLGQRKEYRMAETLSKLIIQPMGFIFAGRWRKYRPIQASVVAGAMIAAVKKLNPGIHIYQYDEMNQLIQHPRQG